MDRARTPSNRIAIGTETPGAESGVSPTTRISEASAASFSRRRWPGCTILKLPETKAMRVPGGAAARMAAPDLFNERTYPCLKTAKCVLHTRRPAQYQQQTCRFQLAASFAGSGIRHAAQSHTIYDYSARGPDETYERPTIMISASPSLSVV